MSLESPRLALQSRSPSSAFFSTIVPRAFLAIFMLSMKPLVAQQYADPWGLQSSAANRSAILDAKPSSSTTHSALSEQQQTLRVSKLHPGKVVDPPSTHYSQSPLPLFLDRCVRCHQSDGSGSPQVPGIPDFNDPQWQSNRAQADLVRSITDGRGNTMPSFRSVLTQQQIFALAGYVKSMDRGSNSTYRSAPLDSRAAALQASLPPLRSVGAHQSAVSFTVNYARQAAAPQQRQNANPAYREPFLNGAGIRGKTFQPPSLNSRIVPGRPFILPTSMQLQGRDKVINLPKFRIGAVLNIFR
ncbi:MAG: c-type cytochrome [Planctomycetota bacterium]